jgi:hypothetical protein
VLTADDAATLRILAGACFRPGETLRLPSGIAISAEEANALTAAYMPGGGQLPDRTPPAHMLGEPVTTTLGDYAASLAREDTLRAELKAAHESETRAWWCAYVMLGCLVVVAALVGYLAAVWPA